MFFFQIFLFVQFSLRVNFITDYYLASHYKNLPEGGGGSKEEKEEEKGGVGRKRRRLGRSGGGIEYEEVKE